MANKKIYRWIALGAAVLALLALIMAFVPTVKILTTDKWKSFSSFSVAFGSVIYSGYTTTKFTFNFVGFLALVFFIPGFVLAIVAAAKSEGKKALSIVSAVFLILSGILMFLLLPVARIYAVGDTKLYKLDAEIFSETVKKASGSVLYGVVALLSGVASIVSAVFNKN